jgi:hypothetical protein
LENVALSLDVEKKSWKVRKPYIPVKQENDPTPGYSIRENRNGKAKRRRDKSVKSQFAKVVQRGGEGRERKVKMDSKWIYELLTREAHQQYTARYEMEIEQRKSKKRKWVQRVRNWESDRSNGCTFFETCSR